MIDIVIDGTDGSGKTSCVTAIKSYLQNLEFSVESCAPYRVKEVYHLWQEKPLVAAQKIADIMNNFREKNVGKNIIIWDRGWPTAFISTDHPELKKILKPFPAITILLLSTKERTYSKAKKNNLQGVWVKDSDLIDRYNRAYHNLTHETENIFRFYPDESDMFDLSIICKKIESEIQKIS